MAIRLECICGQWIEADDDPGAEPVVCGGCGALFELDGVLGSADRPGLGLSPDAKLECPACGGQAEVVQRGAEGRDRFLSCLYCGTEADLPERRGTTRERVTERPGERIVERVTSWEDVGPGAENVSVPMGGDDFARFEVDEQSFGSLEEMERHLRDQLPEDAAQETLEAIRRALREGGGGTTVIEHSHTTSETQVVPAGPSRRRR